MKVGIWARDALLNLLRSALRVPVEASIAMGGAWFLIMTEHGAFRDYTPYGADVTLRVLFGVAAGVALAHTGTLIAHFRRLSDASRIGLGGLLGLIPILWITFAYVPAREATTATLATFFVAAVSAVLVAPWASPEPAQRGGIARAIHLALIHRLVACVLMLGAWCVGLLLAVGAVDRLFELRLRSSLYFDIVTWIWVGLFPWIVAAGIERAQQRVLSPEGAEAVAAGFGWARPVHRWVVQPLQVVYVLILVAYVVRMLVRWEMPANLVSPMWLGAALLVLLGTLLAPEPRAADDTGAAGEGGGAAADLPGAVDRALAAIGPVLALLSPLALAGVLVRIGQYGVTEFRWVRLVYVIALALALVAAMLPALRTRIPARLVAPSLIVLASMLLAFGPLRAESVTWRSQSERVLETLRDQGWSPGERVRPPQDFDAGYALWHEFDWLVRHFGVPRVARLVQVELSDPESSVELAAALGIVPPWQLDMNASGQPVYVEPVRIYRHLVLGPVGHDGGCTVNYSSSFRKGAQYATWLLEVRFWCGIQ